MPRSVLYGAVGGNDVGGFGYWPENIDFPSMDPLPLRYKLFRPVKLKHSHDPFGPHSSVLESALTRKYVIMTNHSMARLLNIGIEK